MRWQILIPISSIVSSMLALSVMWWSSERRRERESYYRFELLRLMIERYENDPEKVFAWQREQVSADRQRRNDSLRLAGYVLLLGGTAALIGGHRIGEESLFGWIPIGVGVAIFLYLALERGGPLSKGPVTG